MAKARSEIGRVYDCLAATELTHYQVRAILIHCLHYTRTECRNILHNRARRRVAESTEEVARLVDLCMGYTPSAARGRIMAFGWPDRLNPPEVEYLIVKAAIATITKPHTHKATAFSRMRRDVFRSLKATWRNYERRTGIEAFSVRELRAYLSLCGVLDSPVKKAFQEVRSSDD